MNKHGQVGPVDPGIDDCLTLTADLAEEDRLPQVTAALRALGWMRRPGHGRIFGPSRGGHLVAQAHCPPNNRLALQRNRQAIPPNISLAKHKDNSDRH